MTRFVEDPIQDIGFEVVKDRFSNAQLSTIHHLSQTLSADRGHDIDGNYYSSFQEGVTWTNFWSGSLLGHLSVHKIHKIILPYVRSYLKKPTLHSADIHTTTPHLDVTRPHIDTPYRFPKWNKVKQLLSIQCAIPLSVTDDNISSTGFVPYSHNYNFDINKCYKGLYNDFFEDNIVQPEIEKGDFLLWNPRTLHSAMPNDTKDNRPVLLLLYCESGIASQLVKEEFT